VALREQVQGRVDVDVHDLSTEPVAKRVDLCLDAAASMPSNVRSGRRAATASTLSASQRRARLGV
jgi:hypothetical protein